MHFAFFVKGYFATSLANFQFRFYVYRSSTDLHCSQCCFGKLAADGYYMHIDFVVKGFLEILP
jgi:hypothetical protein